MMFADVRKFGTVGVLMGGYSSERAISLKSGRAVVGALQEMGVDVRSLDVRSRNKDDIQKQIKEASFGLAFVMLHGVFGEDGQIQEMLDALSIPFVGSGQKASALAINKAQTQELFQKNNLLVPSFVTINKSNSHQVLDLLSSMEYPFVVKPALEGSSIGISLLQTVQDVDSALELAWRYGKNVLVEQYIQGRELTVGILGGSALPIVEIKAKRSFFDFRAKYERGQSDYEVPAALSDEVANDLQKQALKAHHLVGAQDMSRVDFILDQKNQGYILEINTIPGFTETSLLPKAASAMGISFEQLCYQLLDRAYGKKEKKRRETAVIDRL